MKAGTEKKFNEVLRLISEEGLSLTKACIGAKISRTVFHEIVNKDDKKADEYVRAREERYDLLAEQTIELADNCEAKVGNVMKVKEQIASRQWFVTKLYPKKFGNKVEADVNVDGAIKINLNLGE